MVTKKLLLCCASVLFFCISSCSSDNENIIPGYEKEKEQEEAIPFTFTYSIKVNDPDGKNLLSTPYDYMADGYNLMDIALKPIDDKGKIKFEIIENENKEKVLKITTTGEFFESSPIQEITIQWGKNILATIDHISYELEREGNQIVCKKIWFNNDMKWDNSRSGNPLFAITKEKTNSYLPDAKPIILNYPDMVKSSNAFSFHLFRQTLLETSGKQKMNAFISPLSVHIALNMLVNGAEGATQTEILKTLESDDFPLEQMNEHWKDLSNALISVDPSSCFSIANSIWCANNFPVKNTFIQTNKTYYDSEVNTIDFSSPDAIKTINAWCAQKTNNTIPEALDESNPNSIMLLINALYFKGYWYQGFQFNENATTKEPFYAKDGSSENVDMMHCTGHHSYKSGSYADYLSKPFGNGAYSIIFALPKEGKEMEDVAAHLENDFSWTNINGTMENKIVNLSLPKFNMSFTYNMEDFILPAMGMKTPFTTHADFSGISDRALLVSQIIHKTYIDLNENGAEAAALTIIDMEVGLGDEDEKVVETIDFNLNRPFIISIVERSTGSILFLGKIDKID